MNNGSCASSPGSRLAAEMTAMCSSPMITPIRYLLLNSGCCLPTSSRATCNRLLPPTARSALRLPAARSTPRCVEPCLAMRGPSSMNPTVARRCLSRYASPAMPLPRLFAAHTNRSDLGRIGSLTGTCLCMLVREVLLKASSRKGPHRDSNAHESALGRNCIVGFVCIAGG